MNTKKEQSSDHFLEAIENNENLKCSSCGKYPQKTAVIVKGGWSFQRRNGSFQWLTRPPYEVNFFCNPLCIVRFVKQRSVAEYEDWRSQLCFKDLEGKKRLKIHEKIEEQDDSEGLPDDGGEGEEQQQVQQQEDKVQPESQA